MQAKHQVPSNHVTSIAKELTIHAMQNNLIPQHKTTEETATAVMHFYKTIVNTINEDA